MHLYTRWQMQVYTHHRKGGNPVSSIPPLHAAQKPTNAATENGSFAEKLYAPMCRYKDGAQVRNSSHKTGTIKVKNHWATPPEIYHALKDLMQIDKERFASPLNYNPRMAHYWSVHERDQVFGAKWDTYKYQWTRNSVHNPEYEDEDLNQDIGTAIAAARYTDEPSIWGPPPPCMV